MNNDAPRACAARGRTTLRSRLALFLGLAGPLTLAGLAPPSSAGQEARPAGSPTAYLTSGRRVDPRGPDVELLGVEPAPGGRWVALRAVRQRPYELALWFVDLETGEFRAWEQAEPTTAPMVWKDGRLRTEVRRSGRREVVSIDPNTGAWEPLEREGALERDWARAVLKRRPGGLRVLSLAWKGRDEVFELPGGPETDYRLTSAPGVVFYAEPDQDSVRVLRHSMRSGITTEVATIGGEHPLWIPSPDGMLVAISDDHRLRMLRAKDGELVSGPWPAGRVTWLEPDNHAHVLLVAGGQRQVLEVYTGRQIQMGPEEGPQPDLRALPGGGFLVRCEGRLDHLDRDGRLLANLVPGSAPIETPVH